MLNQNELKTTNKLNVTGTAYVSSDITAGDDIIASDEIRNNVASDFWASDNTFISFNGYGNLTHMGGFETNLTSNGYRDTNGQWVSYAANSNTGAAQIGLQPQGNIIFRTNASKSNGTAHNPTERLKIKSDGNIMSLLYLLSIILGLKSAKNFPSLYILIFKYCKLSPGEGFFLISA